MTVIYVQRSEAGHVTAVVERDDGQAPPDEPGWKAVSADDPGLVAFLARLAGNDAANPLVGTDLAMARVLEDLINLLIDQSVIRFTDLPPGAQAKLLARQNTRASMSRLRLMGEGDSEDREII